MTAKPRLSFWQIWNMSFGFLGIQFGFALQGGFMSRIFQTLGAEKMGIYMGIFNMFIVVPQIVAATLLGPALRAFFANEAIFALVISGVSLLLAALALARVHETPDAAAPISSQAH